MGVSEYPIEINTRLVLEKGLLMLGSSRSGRKILLILQNYTKIIQKLWKN